MNIQTIHHYTTRTRMPFLAMVLYVLPFLLTGQEQKKIMLTEADYSLWSNFSLKGIDESGTWASYGVSHANADTLFVQELNGKRKYAYPGSNDGTFAGGYFICKGKDSTAYFSNLEKGQQKVFTGVAGFAATKRRLIVHEFKKGQGRLCFYTTEGVLLQVLPNVKAFRFNAVKHLLAFSEPTEGGEKLFYVDVENPVRKIFVAEAVHAQYERLTWSEGGTSLLSFQSSPEGYLLLSYATAAKQLYVLSGQEAFFEDSKAIFDKPFTVSNDGKRIFFVTKQKQNVLNKEEQSPVQVWNAADKALYPIASKIKHWKSTPHVGMWEPESGRLVKVTDAELPWGGPIGNGFHALTYDPLTYEPQLKPLADRDVYLTDLRNGTRELLLTQQDGSDFHLGGSPEGLHIVYFREGDWYVYSIEKKSHINLTKGEHFWERSGDLPDEAISFRIGGWSSADSSVLLYDQYDVWKFATDGSRSERLTKGRESGIVFRLVPYTDIQKEKFGHRMTTMGTFDLKEPLLLCAKALDNSRNGFFIWEQGKGTQELTYTAKETKNILKAQGKNAYVWTEEDYSTPIQLVAKQNQSKPRVVYGSNAQQSEFLQGRMEVVHYYSPIGTPLSGLLYYPAGFVKGKQYPMVVNLYEVQSKNRFTYVNPTLYNSNGFNIANLTAKGYFVFLPDTVFELEDTGDCALRCVEAAVATVLKRGEVDVRRMGLIGHSFGGFETDYIITKSNLFACAVSGAAITNLVSASHAVARGVGRPNFFKIEYGQTRMHGPLWGRKERYFKSSPVLFADGVTTPLLSWTGQNDTQVEPTQSFEFYMALRRLGKEHILLVYPNEGHDIQGKIADADLTTKIEHWLEHYLKDGPVEDWMKTQ